MLYITLIILLAIRQNLAFYSYVTLNTSEINPQNGTLKTFFYTEAILCYLDEERFSLQEITNISTSTDIYGIKDGDIVEVLFRPIQLMHPSYHMYTYVFNADNWIDFAIVQKVFNAPVYIDVDLNSITPFVLLCGNLKASKVALYGQPSMNVSSLCLSFETYTPQRAGHELLLLRFVQEPNSIVTIYEIYPDLMVKYVLADIKQITRLIFDIRNNTLSDLVYFNLVKVVIKECHETIEERNILNSNLVIKRHNCRFNTRVIIYEKHLCQAIDFPGLYDLIYSDNIHFSNVYLGPVRNVSNNHSDVVITFNSNLTSFSIGIEHTLHFFKNNYKMVNLSLMAWRDFRIASSQQQVININVLANANCTLSLLGLKNINLEIKFYTNEKVSLSVNNSGTYGHVHVARSNNYNIGFANYIPEKVMCVSYRLFDQIFYKPKNFDLTIYRIIKRC